jgi:hypothetical protein
MMISIHRCDCCSFILLGGTRYCAYASDARLQPLLDSTGTRFAVNNGSVNIGSLVQLGSGKVLTVSVSISLASER